MNFENKPLPTKIKMLISITTIGGILLGFNQCVLKNSSSSQKKSSSTYGTSTVPAPATASNSDQNAEKTLPAGMDMPAMNSPATDSELALVDVGVKNFEQINTTMSQLTGIPTNNSNVLGVYNDIVIQLPSDNNLKNFLPSMQVAITKLATEYCDRLIETGDKKAIIWPSINFSQSPTQTFTSANKTAFINQTVDYFFGPIDSNSIAQAKTEIQTLFDSVLTGESMTTNITTKKVVKAVCTASLSSAYVTLF